MPSNVDIGQLNVGVLCIQDYSELLDMVKFLGHAEEVRITMVKSFKSMRRRLLQPIYRWRAFRRLAEYHSRPRSIREVVDWAMNFGGNGYMRVNSIQVPSEILALAEEVADLKPQRILEIGTARGGTLLIWSALASEKVVSCDLNDMQVQAPLYTKFVPPWSNCKVELLSGNSHSSEFKERVVRALDGELVDFLFIDGDHTEEGVTKDYLDYKDLVRPGGLIGFHDIVESQPLQSNQVDRLWRQLVPLAETKEFIGDANQCGFGIGVLRVADSGAPDLS